MSIKGKIRYVFASSNTGEGFYTFIPELLAGLKKVYILKGTAGSGKSTFIRLLGESVSEQGYEVEFWVSSVDPLNPDGVYFPQLKAAVANGSFPQVIEPQYPGVVGEIINISEYWDRSAIKTKSMEIIELADNMEKQRNAAYNLLKNARRIKDKIKKATSGYLNIEHMYELTKELTSEIIEEQPGEKHYFASAVTADGMVNYAEEISSFCKKRYLFKGPAGSGKSTIINGIAQEAKEKGYFVEYYHCGLDIEGLSMVIIPNLQVALIDAGDMEMAVHPWDIIINMTEYLMDYDIDLIKKQTSEDVRSYERLIGEARLELENAYNSLKDLKKIYAEFMNFELVDKKRNEVRDEILSL